MPDTYNQERHADNDNRGQGHKSGRSPGLDLWRHGHHSLLHGGELHSAGLQRRDTGASCYVAAEQGHDHDQMIMLILMRRAV